MNNTCSELKKSDEWYRNIVETTQEGIWMMDENSRTVFANKKMCEMIEYSSEEMNEKLSSCFIDEASWENFSKIVKQGREYVKEKLDVSLITKSGMHIWVKVVSSPVFKNDMGFDGNLTMVTDVTEERKSQKILERSEANLSAIIENADAHIYSLDINLRYITFNSVLKMRLKNLYGINIKRGDLVYEFFDSPDPEERIGWKTIYLEALGGKELQFVKKISIKNINYFTNFSINPIWKDDGVIGLSCYARDITKQVEAEETLRQSEANLRAIFDNTTSCYILMDRELKVLSYNANAQLWARNILKFDLMVGDTWPSYCQLHDRREFLSMVSATLKGKTFDYEVRYPQADSSHCYYEVALRPVINKDLNITGICLAINDIGKRKLAEEKIRLSEEQYRIILETAQEGIWMINEKNQTVFVNPKMAEMLQTDMKNLLISNPLQFMDKESKSIAIKNLGRIKKGITINIEFKFIGSTKKSIWTILSANPIYDKDRKYVGALAMVTDITERKQMESLNIKAGIEAQEKERNRFSKELHDGLGQMLTAVKLNLSALNNSNLTESDKITYMNTQTILGNAIRETRNIAHNLMPKDLTELGLIPTLRDLFEKAEKTSGIKIDLTALKIADRFNDIIDLTIYRICQELLSNAIKHAACSYINVQLTKKANMLILVFKDNGNGISFNTQQHKKSEGIGLKNIITRVKSLNGKLIVNSSPDQGTTFSVEIPLNN